MSQPKAAKFYSFAEERVNIGSHFFGLLMSVLASFFLLLHAVRSEELLHFVSFAVFGISLISLYSASILYHSAKEPETRRKLRIVDHAAIYILIAGTYTPFTLITLSGPIGWSLFAISWAMATAGVVLKIFFTGRYSLVSTLMYVFMGWLIVFAIGPLIDNLSAEGLFWLVSGGVSYTVGAVLYAIKKIPFNHAIFHVFVVLGSFCHIVAVYFYVLPA
ncbi:MAG: hemolysin III family protein [Pseudomonadales bacterium]